MSDIFKFKLNIFFLSETVNNKIMNHYIKARTNGIICQGSPKQLKILQEMFPLYSIDQNDISQALDKYFDQSDPQHCRFLQQACFKFPIAGVSKVYEDFRKNKCSFVAEPNISNYFNNKSFISLKVLENWLDGQGQYPSVENADGLKQQIAQALLSISQQFGYIPNLERFLLYYPNYLLKVQKFKNRFFQQRVSQTSQVTYLSPKNCCFAGLIAAIQVGCPYMITRMANMFLVRGGSLNWITDKKYPQQFNQIFGLFRKIAVAPFSLNQDDLNFSSTAWGKQVYFDLITAGMFVMSMSTLCLAIGLNCDEPCKYIPLSVILDIKNTYDSEKCLNKSNRIQILQQIKQIISQQKILTKEEVQEIQAKQVQPYMKQIGSKLSTYSLYNKFNQVFQFFGMPKHSPINIKYKDNSFFHRNRDVIQKGLEEQRKSDSIQDTKFQCFKSYCIQGSKMALRIFGKTDQNVRIFRKLVQILTYNLCGYHNQQFDYKNNIKLNADLSMPLKFYIRLLSISPLYINKQVLQQIKHEKQGKWEQCFDLGHLAVTVAENKAKLLMSSIQFQLFK